MDIGSLKNTATVEGCRKMLVDLKTPVMADTFVKLATEPMYQQLTLVECVEIMGKAELDSRTAKRQERYLQRSGLRELSVWNQADVTTAIYTPARNLKEQEVKRLLGCEWIGNAKNVMICGATGTGKTWLAAVLGKQACLSGYQTQYFRYARLQEILADARKHCDTATNRRNLNRNKVLIIDDFGTSSISDDLASDVLTVLEEREGVSSVIIASQMPFQEWHGCLGGSRNADAIMDRLLNSSYKFELAGPSLRERTCMDL